MTIARPKLLLAAAILSLALCNGISQVQTWLTNPDRTSLFKPGALKVLSISNAATVVEVDPTRKFQTMDGFGFTLTGGSAQHLVRMNPGARAKLLRELFDATGTNIGVSYLRLSIGASDLNERVFSYNDLPPGLTDHEMKRFDLGPDRKDVVPVLKEILAISPGLKLMGSPWSPPVWMKTNGDTRGGSLRPDCYEAYALYLVRYVTEMAKEGIHIDAITVQNEPLHPGNNPSLLMQASEQALFIKKHLGPAFKRAGLKTRIIIYDHNADRPDYPISILDDPEARTFIDGSAFHLYAGKIETLSKVHAAHPDKNLYFTEQWIGAPGNLRGDLAWHTRNLIVGASRNWCRTVLEWNLAADPQHKPHTDRGGCDRCLGAITIDGDQVQRNPAYYIIAHASKLVRPGSVRVHSNVAENIPNVAFVTPQGRQVIILLNDGKSTKVVGVKAPGREFTLELPAGAVATVDWK